MQETPLCVRWHDTPPVVINQPPESFDFFSFAESPTSRIGTSTSSMQESF